MRTRSSSNLPVVSHPNRSTSNPKRRNRRRSKQPFILEESPIDTMADQRTMVELLRAPTEGYAEAIVVPPILAEQFELKHSGNLLERRTQDVLTIIENKFKVRNSRNKSVVSQVKSCDANSNSSSEIAKLTHAVNQQTSVVTTAMTAILKQFQATSPPAFVKAVEEICVTCSGAHPYYQCLAAGGNTFPKLRDNIQGYVSTAAVNYNQGNSIYRPPGKNFNPEQSYQALTQQNQIVPLNELEKVKRMNEANMKAMQTQTNIVKNELRNEMKNSIHASLSNQTNEIKNMMASLFQINTTSTSGSGSLSSNTVANPKGEIKSITTRSGLVLDGPTVLTFPLFINQEEDECVEETLTDPNLSEYTIKVPPPPVQKYKPPSQRDYIVHQRGPLHPKIPYPSRMLKQKHQEKNEVQIYKFWEMFKQLHINITLADALILIPKYQKMLKALLSNKEKLQELANTPLNENCSAVILKKLPKKLGDPGKFLISCGFSELKCKDLADLGASINLMPLSVWKKLARIARDVFVSVGKFTFPANFVIVDYESDPRVPLILGRPFLRTARALIDVHEVKSDTENVYDDPFDSKGEKIKESKLLIDELDLPCDFLPPFEYPIQDTPFEIITRVVQDKKLAISNASLVLEDFDPPFYEPLFFKEVPRLNLPFSCVIWLSVCTLDRPIGKEGCASWDRDKGTWGGRARVFGTVSVCVRVQERAGEPTVPLQSHSVITTPRRIKRGTIRISQSKVHSPRADETAFPLGDVRYGEAFPTDTSLDTGQDRENIAKTSAMPHEALPRVTSLDGGKGNLEITQLKTRIKTLEDNERRRKGLAHEDASNMGGWIKGMIFKDTVKDSDKSADKKSDSTDEMSHVLGSLGPANILASGGLSGSFPSAAIFTTASVATPTTRVTISSRRVVIGSSSLKSVNIPSISKKDKEKGKMTEPEQSSKEDVLELMSIQLARDLEAKSNEMIAKYLSEYEQAVVGLSHDEKVELINELLMYQRHLAQIKKYQAQLNKPATKTERRNFYMSILRSNAGWKAKDFKGMTFKQIEEKFIPVWEKMQDFMPMNSKIESKRLKMPGIQLDKERSKKLKIAEASGTKPTQEQQSKEPKELSEEELKKMIDTTKVSDEKANELWVELKRLYEPDSRDLLCALQRYSHCPLLEYIPTVRLSVPTADVYIAKKLAIVEDFALMKVNAVRHTYYYQKKVMLLRINLQLLVIVTAVEKPSESDGFEQIVDFLNANQIKYALTMSPTIYPTCIKQFWTTLKIKYVNDDVRLQALVNGKKVVITEASIRHDLKLNDAEGIGFSRVVTPLFGTMMVQVVKEVGDLPTVVQDTPIPDAPSSSQHQRKHKPRRKERRETKVSPIELHREDHVPTTFNDLLPSGEDRMKLKELMVLCTNLSNKVLDMENKVIKMKSSYKAKIAELESRVEKLKEENRKYADIDADAEVNLENVFNLDMAYEETILSMQDVTDADVKEVTEEMVEVITSAKIIVDEVSTTSGELNATNEEPVKDKGKAKLVEELEIQKSRKAQIVIDEEVARRIEAEWNADIKDNIDWNEVVEREAKELKRNLEIVPDDEDDVFVNVTPLSSKPPTIMDYKIYKEGKNEHFQIIRANGNHQMYLAFCTILKNFDREDFEVL
nr:reverse transcriptase domain-containing protein [Tanacetum cinerariifolium]